jgi:hypothetical protein
VTLNPEDIGVVRDLMTLARARGWTHLTYGERGSREHVWRSPAPAKAYAEKVALWNGALEYRKADHHVAKGTTRPESVRDAREWLRLMGLVPSVKQVAEAVLAS